MVDTTWRPIKTFKDVGDINMITTSIIAILDQFLPFESYKSTTPIPHLVEFIKCLVHQKEPWTKTPDARKLCHNTHVFFQQNITRNLQNCLDEKRNLLSSIAASLLAAANMVLGYSLILTISINETAKGSILKMIKRV